MKIAITGGAGFIGAHLTRSYLDAGHDVLIIDNLCRGSREAVDPRARLYEIDVRDKKLRHILQQERPELVSHHVAQWQHHLPFEQALPDADVHIHGLLNVLNSCIDGSVKKIIFASGGNDIYGQVEADRLPLSEETPLCPQQSIDISRTACEWYVRYYHRYYGLQYTILRYASVYGDSIASTDLRHPINYFISQLAEQHRPIIRGTGEEQHDHIFIDDVIRANHNVMTQGNNQTLHISTGQGYTLNQLYQLVATTMQSTLQPVYLSGPLTQAAIALDNTRAKQLLNWQPEVSLQEGIYHTVKRTYNTQKTTEPLSIERLPITANILEDLQAIGS
jgi:UDP-glucose 4-epimerase